MQSQQHLNLLWGSKFVEIRFEQKPASFIRSPCHSTQLNESINPHQRPANKLTRFSAQYFYKCLASNTSQRADWIEKLFWICSI